MIRARLRNVRHWIGIYVARAGLGIARFGLAIS
jgi:hypothetical protein